MQKWSLAVHCPKGMSNILEQELLNHSYQVKTDRDDCCYLEDMTFQDIVYLNNHIHCAESVEILLYRGVFESLEAIRAVIAQLAFAEYFANDRTFGVRAQRSGQHDFISVDISRSVAAGISESIRREGLIPKANLKDPDLHFQCRLDENDFSLSLNTTGEWHSDATDLPYKHQAPLKRSLAAGLIYSSRFMNDGKLFDPMCGGGTIALTAQSIQNQIPISEFRNYDFAYKRHHYFQEAAIPKGRSRAFANIDDTKIVLGDSSRNKIKGAIANLEHFNLREGLRLYRGNATKMSYLVKELTPKSIVVNPPYGIRVKNTKDVDELYQNFATRCKELEIEEIVAITPRKRAWIESFEQAGYKLQHSQPVDFSGLPTSFFTFRLNQN